MTLRHLMKARGSMPSRMMVSDPMSLWGIFHSFFSWYTPWELPGSLSLLPIMQSTSKRVTSLFIPSPVSPALKLLRAGFIFLRYVRVSSPSGERVSQQTHTHVSCNSSLFIVLLYAVFSPEKKKTRGIKSFFCIHCCCSAFVYVMRCRRLLVNSIEKNIPGISKYSIL